MTMKPVLTLSAAALASLLAVMPIDLASAGGSSNYGTPASGPNCKTGQSGSTVIINKPVSIYKPVTINKAVTINNNVSIYKPVTIQKNINVWNPVTINKNVDIQNNIDLQKNIDIQNNITINKNVDIQKSITINKGGSASATATASAAAQSSSFSRASAFANANAGSGAAVYYGSYSEENVIYKGVGGDVGSVAAQQACEMQEATVMKAIHAMCVADDGREFPASHMTAATFIDNSYEGEIARCIPGAHLKITIGDVVPSDQGMAGTYEHGATLICADHEAVRHYKNGMLKCEAALPVKDCTERTNLRKWGTGDMFFSYRTQVCATPARQAQRSAVEVTGMTLEGGVGDGR
jgi:hypothetical protein